MKKLKNLTQNWKLKNQDRNESKIYNQFELKDTIETNQNFDTENIRDFKPIGKLKYRGPEMKVQYIIKCN